MESHLYQIIMNSVDIWGYTAIIIGLTLGSACLPVPSEFIYGFAGYLVFLGRLDFTSALAAGVAGDLSGSIIAYLAGYYGGRPFAVKYGRYILPAKKLDITQCWFDRYGLKAVFFSRMLPVVRAFISLPAGFARINFIKFIILTILGSVIWATGLISTGKLLGENWPKIYAVGHQASLVIGIGLLLLGIYYLKRNREATNPE